VAVAELGDSCQPRCGVARVSATAARRRILSHLPKYIEENRQPRDPRQIAGTP
jgi:hypothetical protein